MRFDKTPGPSSPMRRKQSKKNNLKKTSSSRGGRSPKTTKNGESKGSAQVEGTNGRVKKETKSSRARSRSKSLSRKVARSRSRRASRSRARKASRSRSRKASRSRSRSLRRHRTSERNFESREPPEPTSFFNRGRSEQRTNPRFTRDSQMKSGDTPWALLARRSSSKTRADTKTVRRPSASNSALFKKSITETASSKRNTDWRGNAIPDSLQSTDADQRSYGKGPLGATVAEKEFLSSPPIDLEPNDLGTKPPSQIPSVTPQPDSEDGGIELISMVTASGKPFTRIVVERAAGYQHWPSDLPLDLDDKHKGAKLPMLKNNPIDKSASPKAKRFLRVFPWRQSAKTSRNQRLKHGENTQVEGCSRRLQTSKPHIPYSAEASSGTKSIDGATLQDFSPPRADEDAPLPDKVDSKGSCKAEDDTLSKPSELSGIEAGFELIAMWMKDDESATQTSDSMPKNLDNKNARPPVAPETPSTKSILTGGNQTDSGNPKKLTTSPLQGSTGSREHESTFVSENFGEQGSKVDESDQRKENRVSSARNDVYSGDEQRDDAPSAVNSTVLLSEEQKTGLHEKPDSITTNPMVASDETSLKEKSRMGVGTTQTKESFKTHKVNPKEDIPANKEVVRDFQTIYMAPSRRRELESKPFSKSLGNDRSDRSHHASRSAKHSVASSETSGTRNRGSVSVDWEEDGTTGESTINTFDTDDEEETMRRKLSICTSTSSSRLSSALGSQLEIISVLDNPSIYDEETGTVDSKALMKAIDSTEIYSLGSSSTAGDNYSASEGSLTRVNHALDTIKRYATRHGIPERDLLEAVASTARSRAQHAIS